AVALTLSGTRLPRSTSHAARYSGSMPRSAERLLPASHRPAGCTLGNSRPEFGVAAYLAYSTEQQTISRASVGLRSERGPILLSVMLSVGLIAIDATILATAVPSIVDDLGGFTQFPWLFSIFLLAQAV